jgi:hypothetical protein
MKCMTSGTAGEIKNSNLKAFLNFAFCPNNRQCLHDACRWNTGRGFSFRLLYRVVFFSFGLIFASFYHGRCSKSASSEYGRREDKTRPNKFKDEFKGKPLNVKTFLSNKTNASLTWQKMINKLMVARRGRKQIFQRWLEKVTFEKY